ncbi:MAG TPA: hypothetical protein VG432_10215 [Gemmatimonadaceae bacterium]|nr:hypothetical protein [Gemmatimonadaceae bacterium]
MTSARLAAVAALLLCFPTGRATSQAHARHHDAPPEKLGTVHFETSCAPAVAPQFDRAVALLHSFEFGASIRAFDKVLAADSSCAMAYWGIALSRWSNPMAAGARTPLQLEQGRAAVESASRSGAHASERERAYMGAVNRLYADYEHTTQSARVDAYERAMADLAAHSPADTEAAIFHAIALVASADPADKTYAKQLEAGAVLESLWVKQPDHPGLAHYIIHAYDYPALADKAREAAERYSRIAPSAAHALHMPAHTFTRLGLWRESVDANRRSADAALRDASIAEALHASDYMEYAYLQMRQLGAARRVLETLPALAARFDVKAVTGAAPGSAGVFALAAIRARYALERRDWAAAARLVPKASDFPWTEAMTYFARALGASRRGDTTGARASVDSLSAIRQRLAAMGEQYWAEQVAIEQLAAQAWLDRAAHRDGAALDGMRRAAEREDATEKSAVTPGPLAPARELLAEMLLESGRGADALAEYRAVLVREPNRYHALDGARRAAAALGDRAAAASYAAQLKALTTPARRAPGRRSLLPVPPGQHQRLNNNFADDADYADTASIGHEGSRLPPGAISDIREGDHERSGTGCEFRRAVVHTRQQQWNHRAPPRHSTGRGPAQTITTPGALRARPFRSQ